MEIIHYIDIGVKRPQEQCIEKDNVIFPYHFVKYAGSYKRIQ